MSKKLHCLTKTTLYHEDEGMRSIPMHLTAEYGFRPNASRPYFSITADLKSRRSWLAGGCLHEEIAAHLPDLAPLIQWHLCDADGTPMHYTANAVFHAQVALGISRWSGTGGADERVNGLANFQSHVVFGAVDGDQLPDCLQKPILWDVRRETVEAQITAWCEARLPALQAAFLAEMTRFNLITEGDERE